MNPYTIPAGLDAWITGNQGYDHPDNAVCPECGQATEFHCDHCGGCGAPGHDNPRLNRCEDCAMTCDYCGDESETVRAYHWKHESGRAGIDYACVFCAIGNDLITEG